MLSIFGVVKPPSGRGVRASFVACFMPTFRPLFPFVPSLAICWCAPQEQFREAVTRMESLMEEEAKDSVSAIKNLRDKAMLAKDR